MASKEKGKQISGKGSSGKRKRKEDGDDDEDSCDNSDFLDGVVREQPPAHYTLRIESLSSLRTSLAKRKDRRISSQEFTASGHKWVLIVDLNGEKDDAGDEHISMYLKLVDRLKPGEVVNAVFSFFVYNQQLDKYFTKQDMIGKRFKCEANVIVNHQYCWRVNQYSKLKDRCESPVFTFNGISWTLQLYPKGNAQAKGKNISIYLCLDDPSKLSIGVKKIFAEYEITLKDQLGSKHIKKSAINWYDADVDDWGFPAFLPLSDLWKGYLLNDALIIEVNIKTMFSLEDV
ncbi:hypothetical protein Dimus_009864 [Dionaea muscipula]